MKSFISMLLLSLGLMSAASAAELPLGANLQGLLTYAREHNSLLLAMRYEADAAALRVQPAGTLPDPVLRTELLDVSNQGNNKPPGFLPSQVGGTRYLLMQSVPWFGKLDLLSGIAKTQAIGISGQTAVTWSDLSGKIKSAYALAYSLSETIRLTHKTLELTKYLENIAQTRYANGQANLQDVIRAQIEQTDLQSTLIDLENEHHHVNLKINNLLSRSAYATLVQPQQFRPVPVLAELSVLENKLRAQNPQLHVADASVTEASISRDLTYKNRYPGMTFGIAPTQSGSTVKSWDLMMELNLPLQQESRRSQEYEAQAKLASSTARQAALLNQMLSELSESVSGFESAQRTGSLITTRLIPQTELSFQSALSGYETGKVDFVTLLDTQRKIRSVQQQSIKAQYEVQLRLAEIERLIGEEL